MSYIETEIVPILVVVINMVTIFHLFPSRYGLRFSVTAIVLFTVAVYSGAFLLGALGIDAVGTRGMLYIPFLVWLFKGQFFQKVFYYIYMILVPMLLGYLISVVILIFIPEKNDLYYIIFLFASIIVYAAYIALMLSYGKRFFIKLFSHGRNADWALYTLGITASFVILYLSRLMSLSPQLYIPLFFFIFWSIGTLCFAIINTHEKTKRRVEAEFASGIISSGRGHYEKMNEMQDTLRILRHDVKYHVSAAREMLRSGKEEELDGYLSDVESLVTENEPLVFCANTVVNALLSGYAERCRKHDIRYAFTIVLPDTMSIPNYELCVVLGNLLENAVEAALKLDNGRYIELNANYRREQFAVTTKNSFDGKVLSDDGLPISGKKDGGFGLRSVRAVTDRYDGYMLTEWDANTFTVYVMLNV
ncbi:MAG: GHKL domain-containing protein [Oscillospiraceae bacterium]|nr:GHKL domain-containing protein [Oscillospiraceae bacterium]